MYQNAKKYFITAKKKDSILALLKSNLPKNEVAELICQAGGVWFNKKRQTNNSTLIPAGQTIIVYTCNTQGKLYKFPKKDIKFDSPDFMAIYKPAGITTMSDRSNHQYNLTFGVQAYYKEQGLDYNVTPINRLDFMVDGLILFPKHKQAEKDLFRLSRERKIHKMYQAELPIFSDAPAKLRVKDKLGFLRKAHHDPNGKPSETLFILHAKTQNTLIYSIIPFTGRRHQIRFHAAKYLKPIIGDGFYESEVKTEDQQIKLSAVGYNFYYQNEHFKIRLKQ